MAITEEQRKERKKFIGSSDIAALFTDDDGKSLDPFKTAVDVWASKVYDHEDKPETDAMSRGNRYESALIEFAEQELGVRIETNPDLLRFICKKHPIFACNLDGFSPNIYDTGREGDTLEIVEAKTTGLTGEWGEPGTDDVPFRVNLQVHQQMLCTGWNKAHIAVLLGRWGLTEEMFVIERNEDIIKAIINRGEQFWNDYVLTEKAPPDSELGSIDSFKFIKRIPGKYAEVPLSVLQIWDNARQDRLDAEKAEEVAKLILIKGLGDAEGAKWSKGRELTYFQQKSNKVSVDLLKTKYPDVYLNVFKEGKHRVLRIRKLNNGR